MKLQISTDYAIRILKHLHVRDGDLLTAMDVAQSVGITYPFFIKIANLLKQKGLLGAVQGRHGGYFLGRPAHTISVLDVFQAIEGDLCINRCLDEGQRCAIGMKDGCKTHEFLCALQRTMIKEMSGQSIADLAS